MTPAKKKPPTKAPVAWTGPNRRRPPPPPRLNWWPTRIGVLLITAGVAVHVLIREGLDLVPLALIIVGGAMIDKEAVRAASKMFSIRRGGSDATSEQETGGA